MTGPEAQFQSQVLELAKRYRWKVFRQRYNPRGSTSGWPDLVCVRDGRILALELKSPEGRNQVSPAQTEWIVALAQVPGVTARVVRPADLGWIVEELRKQGDEA